ncbi:sialate O-acetylesterase [Sphingomonas canadensis]|uniref:Sialate O-acetylesterase n=1 Tax=Sphingomonas canadensis TaxID=1219257 RepID=A0ABW3HC86_9SPHN|nr:sialate O-acetylesterase [Sphingomonas canadensis]MCW3838039.1 9-O-acetylesterase [Sphingomonas canadensis]
MPKLIAGLIAAVLFATPAAAQPDAPLLASIFQDHAVLQRDRPIRLWGSKRPGETVTVTMNGIAVTASSDKSTAWSADLPALPAGGPYSLTVSGSSGRSQTMNDVLVGDVWLCSGQSNMEWPVSASIAGPAEVAAANDPQVRILSVQHDTAAAPQADFLRPVAWQPVTPQTIGDFSAVCWFLARELRKTEKVPFGLIDSSWGGTAINAWRPEATMAGDAALREPLRLLALQRSDPQAATAQWGRSWGEWWRGRSGDAPGTEPWQPNPPGEWRPVPSFSQWEGWGVPELAAYNGVVWYRTEINLTPAQAKQAATLELGVIDDLDMTFVNGTGVGSTASWDLTRSYPLARKLLRPGRNGIAVAAYDSWGGGGMWGAPEQFALRLADGTRIPLGDPARWRYRVTPGSNDLPHAPWESSAGLSSIYNAMIAPLGRYGLRGAAWYQGESDAGMAQGYAGRLAAMMSGWRAQLGDPALPFVIVQLPQWGARVTAPAESGFASIRDQQRRAVAADAHAALVVTIDIGDAEDLHPVNKQDVGTRAARAARAAAYGSAEPPSGPRVTAARRVDGNVAVSFADITGTLLAYSGAQVLGFELCGVQPGSCRFVPGRIAGAAVVLDTAGGPAYRVRFCWGDSPVCNLYDGSGLPAAPFELAVE